MEVIEKTPGLEVAQRNSVTHLILAPVVLFFCIPTLFISQNIGDLPGLNIAVFAVLAVISLVALLLLLSLNSLFGKKHLGFLLGTGAEFLCFYIIAAGFVFPVSISTGMVDPEFISINKLNLLFALLAAGALTRIAKTKHAHTLYSVLIAFIALNFVMSLITIVTQNDPSQDPDALYRASTQGNVFVLSLDGISGSAASEILVENPSLAEGFDGFTLFANATSSSPATSASTAASLLGNRNFKAFYDTEIELWNSAPDDLLTNAMQNNGYDVSTFGVYTVEFQEKTRKYKSSLFRGIGVSELLNFTIARVFTSIFVSAENVLEELDLLLLTDFDAGKVNERELISKIAASNGPRWKRELSATVIELVSYIRKLKAEESTPVAHFLHFTFTHFPVEFDRDCRYRGDDSEWFENRQNRYGVKEETYCALSILSRFIVKLKELNIFENSVVVFKSDHGKPVSYYEPGTIEAEVIHGHSLWGYGRYEPFLAVKAPGPGRFALRNDPSSVILDDLARSIYMVSLNASLCTRYPGFDLFSEDLSIPESAEVPLFVVRSDRSDFKFDSHDAVTVRRQASILKNLYQLVTGRKFLEN
ncbi:sulfatase-like hydrolase/transferase [Pseudomonadota bacterium]